MTRLRTDDTIHHLIHKHYDLYPHYLSGWMEHYGPFVNVRLAVGDLTMRVVGAGQHLEGRAAQVWRGRDLQADPHKLRRDLQDVDRASNTGATKKHFSQLSWKDFQRRAPPDAKAKAKERAVMQYTGSHNKLLYDHSNLSLQKLETLDEEGHAALFDLCALWCWLEPRMREAFPGDIVDKHLEMFWRGPLAMKHIIRETLGPNQAVQ